MHRFNRFELKYLVPIEQVGLLRAALSERLESDPLSPIGGYGVWSIYYDTPGLRFYWEKVDGLPLRRKLRMRAYGPPDLVTDDTTVHVEIKQRVNRISIKRRLPLPYSQAKELCAGRDAGLDDSLSQEVRGLIATLRLQPIAMVGYQREAWVGGPYDSGVRVTFDTRLRGRDRDLWFGQEAVGNRYIVNPGLCVVEIKVDDRIPRWIAALIASHQLSLTRLSKYGRTIEAFGLTPRSASRHAEEAFS